MVLINNPPFKKVKPKFFILFNYTILLTQTGEQKTVNHGGNNKQTILLNIDRFFSLSLVLKRENDRV